MYLVKSLANATGPVSVGKLVSWTPNQVRLVDDTAVHAYENRAAAFTVLAGPDFSDVAAAAVGLLDAAEVAKLQFANGVQILAGAAAPTDFAAAVAASKVFASGGANNDLTFTAVVAGAAGNDFTIAITQSVNVSDPLAVNVNGNQTVISLPTDGASAPVAATAAEIKTAWDLSARVADITVAFEGTGAGNVSAAVAAPLANGAAEIPGTGDGVAEPSTLYLSKTQKKLYINGGTLAQPVWKIVTSA